MDPMGGAFANAAILSRYPGRTAMLLVTSPRTEDDFSHGAALVAHGLARASEMGAWVVQALVEPMRTRERAMFEKGGMRTIGTLAYLELQHPQACARTPRARDPRVTIRPWSPSERTLLEGLLEETYIDSLDCPGLSSMRPTSDILDGHMQTGKLDPQRWLILEIDGVPSGISLMSEIPSSQRLEIVYFGLARRARGRGLAGHLLDSTLALADGSPVTLACDEGNAPAIRLYQSRAFCVRLRRTAMVAPAGCIVAEAIPTGYPLGANRGAPTSA